MGKEQKTDFHDDCLTFFDITNGETQNEENKDRDWRRLLKFVSAMLLKQIDMTAPHRHTHTYRLQGKPLLGLHYPVVYVLHLATSLQLEDSL